MTVTSGQEVKLTITKTLEAIRVHACQHCNAPGVFKSADDPNAEYYINGGWKGIVLAADDVRIGTQVGDICPNCGSVRSKADDNLGVIWQR